jgi:hypothetical protein
MSRSSIVWAIVACVGTCFAASNVLAVNYVVNGDFEGGTAPGSNDVLAPTGWTWFGVGDNTVALSSDTPSGSGNSADLDIQEVLGLPWLVQDVDIASVATGTNMTLTASVKELRQFTPEFDAWIAAQVYMLPSSESGAILASGFAFYTSPTWQTQSFDIVKPAGANIARILFTPQDPGFGVGTGRYLVDNVSLTAPSSIVAGDFSGDGRVDGADLSLLLANWGATVPPTPTGWTGDAPTAAGVDADELSRLLSNWGTGTSTAIPEPSTAVGLAILGVLLGSRPHRGAFAGER